MQKIFTQNLLEFMLWRFIRFFLFLMDPERSHTLACLTLKIIQRRKVRKKIRHPRCEIHTSSSSLPQKPHQSDTESHSCNPPPLSHSVFGLEFHSRVGLAAGFDKDAEILGALPTFGFGFAEIGTVTPRGQMGQERPRLFRDIKQASLLNRMGFNNRGALHVAQNLNEILPHLPSTFRVGINIGKNKDTPLEEAATDYLSSARLLKSLADYLVINVSSPNTPQLRHLQTPEALKPLIEGVLKECNRGPHLGRRRPAILLKLSPDLNEKDMSSILTQGEKWGLGGWVLTNTLPGSIEIPQGTFQGGWSGQKLQTLSCEKLRLAKSLSSLPIISVGGIMSTKEAEKRIELGADLVQIYTGWIYGGPFFPRQLSRALNSHPTSISKTCLSSQRTYSEHERRL